MGEIINSTFISIDGVINHMEAWHFAYIDDESEQIALEQLRASEALLMGRHTYEAYASVWPQRGGVLADMINSMPKYVASATLDKAAWNNTTVIKADLVAEVTRLKRQGGDILMNGFGPVANTLIANGLLDVGAPALRGHRRSGRPAAQRGQQHPARADRLADSQVRRRPALLPGTCWRPCRVMSGTATLPRRCRLRTRNQPDHDHSWRMTWKTRSAPCRIR